MSFNHTFYLFPQLIPLTINELKRKKKTINFAMSRIRKSLQRNAGKLLIFFFRFHTLQLKRMNTKIKLVFSFRDFY